jgi:hypothetical protein
LPSKLTALSLSLSLATAISAAVVQPEVFVTGLETPTKLLAISHGVVLVAEAGTSTPNTGRVSLIDAAGNRRTLVDGLPSGLAAPDSDIDGPNGLALDGRMLYVAIGEGDGHVNGPAQGTLLPNPKGPSSPLFATVLAFQLSDDVDQIRAPFVVTSATQSLLEDGKWVNIDNGMGQTATAQVIVAFRPDRPDPHSIYRNTHLYGLALLQGKPDRLMVDDAGDNVLWQLSLTQERPQVLRRFANITNPSFPAVGGPTSEAVPTSVRPFGNQLLVALLGGFPFTPGTSSVMMVNPANGSAQPFITGLTSAIDVLPRFPGISHNEFLVLEYSTNLLTGAPGQLVLSVAGQTQVVASGLTSPSSMAVELGGGEVYITDRTDGTLLKVTLP